MPPPPPDKPPCEKVKQERVIKMPVIMDLRIDLFIVDTIFGTIPVLGGGGIANIYKNRGHLFVLDYLGR